MRLFAIALAGVAAATTIPTAAEAQRGGWGNSYQRELRQIQRECQRDLRRADTRRERFRAQRECRRELAELQRRYRHGWRGDRRWDDDRWDRGHRDDRRWDDRRWRDRDRDRD